MGQRQPHVTADEIIKVLKSLGFEKVDQSGSHQKLEASINRQTNNCILSCRRDHKAEDLQKDSWRRGINSGWFYKNQNETLKKEDSEKHNV